MSKKIEIKFPVGALILSLLLVGVVAPIVFAPDTTTTQTIQSTESTTTTSESTTDTLSITSTDLITTTTVSTSMTTSVGAGADLDLWVDSFSDMGGKGGSWETRVAPPPYLNDNSDNWIHEDKTGGATEGYFGFQNTAVGGTINSVTLYIECYGMDTNEKINIYIDSNDGSGYDLEGFVTVDQLSYAYETLLCTSLDTWAEINYASMYVEYIGVGGGDDVWVRRAYLRVNYSPATTVTSCETSCETSTSITTVTEQSTDTTTQVIVTHWTVIVVHIDPTTSVTYTSDTVCETVEETTTVTDMQTTSFCETECETSIITEETCETSCATTTEIECETTCETLSSTVTQTMTSCLTSILDTTTVTATSCLTSYMTAYITSTSTSIVGTQTTSDISTSTDYTETTTIQVATSTEGIVGGGGNVLVIVTLVAVAAVLGIAGMKKRW